MKSEAFGLDAESLQKIRSVFRRHGKIHQALIYGSRAMGTHRINSDIDVTLKGEDLTHSDLLTIATELDDLMLPYKFDLSLFDHIDNASLLEHIARVAKTL